SCSAFPRRGRGENPPVRMQRNSFKQVAEDPFLHLPGCAGRQIKKADTALSRKGRPHHLPTGFDLQFGIPQLKPYPDFLQGTNGCHGLHADAIAAQVAYDSPVRLIQGDVSEGAEFVPMLSPRLSCGRCSCVHTHRRSCSTVETGTEILARHGPGVSDSSGSGIRHLVVFPTDKFASTLCATDIPRRVTKVHGRRGMPR